MVVSKTQPPKTMHDMGEAEPMPKKARRQTAPRKAKEYTVPVKLWLTPEMHEWLARVAEEREWSIPQVIRRAVREAQTKKLV